MGSVYSRVVFAAMLLAALVAPTVLSAQEPASSESILGLIPVGQPAAAPNEPASAPADPAAGAAVPPAPPAPVPAAAAPTARATATKAATQSVTISDFQFSPGTITVTAGDSLTFTNNGPTPHSATADGGSFDTGILASGKSKTEQFAAPGTYPFHCAPHPFMKATVRVLAASGSGSSDSSSDAPAPSAETPSGRSEPTSNPASSSGAPASAGSSRTSSSGGNLAFTGANLIPLAILGAMLIAAGAIGIRFSRARASAACDR